MNNKLIISDFYKDIPLGFLFEDENLIRIKSIQNDSLVGNIYCGYVKDIVKNLNACFVEFGNDKKGFLQIKDTQNIKCGNKILIQVVADEIKSKNYLLTSDICLSGKYLILTEGNNNISISKKIKDKDRRIGLKEILLPYENDEYGFIIRTNSENASEKDLITDAQNLIEERLTIRKKLEHISPKSCLKNRGNIKEIVEEFHNKYKCDVITDCESIYVEINDLDYVSFNDDTKVSLYNKYSLDKHLNQATNKHVWLKSGAYLIIEPTEALTVIDVNTGKAEINSNREGTFKKINLEAAKEVLRQVQIRNITGIIIIDFINMQSDEDYIELKTLLENLSIYDYSKCYVVGFTKLGLLEMSRKKADKPLHQIINEKVFYEKGI